MNYEDLPTNDEWEEYDWRQVFAPDDSTSGIEVRIMPPGGGQPQPASADTAPPALANVVEVTHWHGESPEGYGSLDMAALLHLEGGRWCAVTAWADTTGWGCRDGVEFIVGDRDDLITYGFGDEHRRLLGLVVQP